MNQRKYILIALVGAVALFAVALRVRSQLNRPRLDTGDLAASQPAERVPLLRIAPPRDYVVDPMVVPAEAGAGPKRIISLAPSVTEIVCALGMRDRLVGRTRYCQWPPGIDAVEAVGVLSEANYSTIKALEPDLILSTTNSGDVPANLTKLGLRCEAVPHEGIEEVYAAIERIGQVCGRPQTAHRLAAAIRDDMDRVRTAAAELHVRPKRAIVLFGELPVPPQGVFVAGPGLFLDTLIIDAGHQNAAREVLKASHGEIPLERMRVLDPEIILEFRDRPDSSDVADAYRAWREVGDLQAIRERRVRTIGGLEWLSAGPRIALELYQFVVVLSEGD